MGRKSTASECGCGGYNIRDTVGFLTSANGKTARIIDGTAKTKCIDTGGDVTVQPCQSCFCVSCVHAPNKIIRCKCDTDHQGGRKGGQGPLNFWNNQKVFFQTRVRELFLILSSGTFLPCVPHLTVSLYLCSSGSNARGESRAQEGRRVSSKSPSRVRDRDEGVAGMN